MSNEPTDDVPEGIDAALADSDDLLHDDLAALLTAPPDLSARTAREVTDTLLQRSTLAAAVDTLSVGWNTIRILFGTDHPEDRS